MVDEYLSEREQAEQLKAWFRENWIWLATGVALAVGGWLGWRWWQDRLAERSLAAGQELAAMLQALEEDRRDEGRRLGGEIAGRYPGTPYADHAELVLARLDVESGDLASAERRLLAVADGTDDEDLALVARLRAARVQLALGRHDDALATLDALDEPALEARVEELRGDVHFARGDRDGALAAWRRAEQAAAAPGRQPLVDAELLALKIASLAAGEAEE